MATCSYAVSTEKSASSTSNYGRHFGVDTLNEGLNKKIPPYSKINSVIAKFTAKRSGVNLSTSNGDARIYFYNGVSASEGVEVGYWSNEVGTSYKEFSANITKYCRTETVDAGIIVKSLISDYPSLYFSSMSSVIRTHYIGSLGVYWDFTPPTYVLSLSASTGGTVSGGGTYEVGSTATIKATPNTGYRFVKWSDGNTNAERQITITSSEISANVTNRSYTAYFEVDKIYVTYDSIFDFQRWANTNLKSWSLMNVSNVTATGFTGQALVDDAYTEECRPLIPVTKGKTYTFECNTSGGGFEFFIFNCNLSGGWADFTYGNTNKFNFTPSMDYISIRCDIVGTGTVVNFDNFRIYPADCPYMGSTVSAVERTDINAWSMPTPTRDGYRFLGWFTQPNGGGVKYTSSSAFPSGGADLVLYSHWEIAKINKIYVGTSQPKAIYIGTQEVKEVYIGTTKVYG